HLVSRTTARAKQPWRLGRATAARRPGGRGRAHTPANFPPDSASCTWDALATSSRDHAAGTAGTPVAPTALHLARLRSRAPPPPATLVAAVTVKRRRRATTSSPPLSPTTYGPFRASSRDRDVWRLPARG